MSRRANPTLRSVFTDDILPGSGKKQVPHSKTAVQSFPKKTASAAVAAPAVAAQVASRDYASRAPASKCCSIKNCDEEPLVVGGDTESGAIAVSILQEPSTAPLCVVSTHGCAPRQRPVENGACLYVYPGSGPTQVLQGGIYPLLCLDDSAVEVVCASTIDVALVYLAPNFTFSDIGSISILLVSDIGLPYHQIDVKSVADLVVLTNSAGFFTANVPSGPCLVQPGDGETLATAIFRIELGKIFGGGYTIPPKNVLAVQYCASTPSLSSNLRAVSVVARGTTQAPNCGILETSGLLSQFVENLQVSYGPGPDFITTISFCIFDCLGNKISPNPVIVTFQSTDLTVITSQQVPPIPLTGCYLTSFSGLNPLLLYTVSVSFGGDILYQSCEFSLAPVS